jgi:hypothetical protein
MWLSQPNSLQTAYHLHTHYRNPMQTYDDPRDTEQAEKFITMFQIETLLDANQIAQQIQSEIASIGIQKELNNVKLRGGKLTQEEYHEWYAKTVPVIRLKKRQIRWIESWKSEQQANPPSIENKKKSSYRANYYDLELDEQLSQPDRVDFETLTDAEHFIDLLEFELGDMGYQIELNRLKVKARQMDKKEYHIWYRRVLEVMISKKRQLRTAMNWKFDKYRECYVEANPVIDQTQTLDKACREFSKFILTLPRDVSVPLPIMERIVEIRYHKYIRLNR